MFFGDDHEVDGRPRVDVPEREHLVVLVQLVHRRLARGHVAKQAFGHQSLLAGYPSVQGGGLWLAAYSSGRPLALTRGLSGVFVPAESDSLGGEAPLCATFLGD
jgi:hypothetical protein